MYILYQWGQIDPSHDPYFGVVFVVFFLSFYKTLHQIGNAAFEQKRALTIYQG